MPREIVSARNVTWAEAKELLKRRIEEGFTTVHHDRVFQYLDTFAMLSAEDSRRLVEEIMSETGLDEEVSVVIANICPLTPGEVRSILEMRRELKYDEETVSKILDIVSRYCGAQQG